MPVLIKERKAASVSLPVISSGGSNELLVDCRDVVIGLLAIVVVVVVTIGLGTREVAAKAEGAVCLFLFIF